MHENLLRVFSSIATLENANEHDEVPCRIVVINTFVMGMPIRVTQRVVPERFNMSDIGLSDEHEGFPMSMVIPNDNALDLSFH